MGRRPEPNHAAHAPRTHLWLGTGFGPRHKPQALANRTPVAQIMRRDPLCVHEDLGIGLLTGLLVERGVRGAPVLDAEGRLCGYVSTSDLVRARYERGDTRETAGPLCVHTRRGVVYELPTGFHEEPDEGTVADVMTPLACSAHEAAPVATAAAVMALEGLHQLPVVNDDDKVVGLVDALDILAWLARESAPGSER
jgi:CBS domain-containing protein